MDIQMKNKILIKAILIIACFTLCPKLLSQEMDSFYPKQKQKKCVRGCLNWGLFAEFFWTLNHFQYCQANGLVPVVYWGDNFAYYSSKGFNGSGNCWEYYFEPVSKAKYKDGDPIRRELVYNSFTTIWDYDQYVINIPLLPPEEQSAMKPVPVPRGHRGGSYPVGSQHLYDKSFRKYVKENLIDPYVKIKKSTQKKVDAFYKESMQGKRVVGIHLRGGFIWGEVGVVPLECICTEANLHADKDTIFLIATDQYPLIEKAKTLLNGPVIYYDCYRQETTTSPTGPAQLDPQLGEDVLVEVQLLARCDYFVHTISNVSTAVLYFNPNLQHTMMYCGN